MRAIDLSARAVAALRIERKRQIAAQARAGAEGFKWCDSHGLVFTSFPGFRVSDSALRKDFKRVLRAAGLARALRPHDLRHTAATML